MSWASHPTNEMPTSPGRHRRRRAGTLGLSIGAVVLVLAIGGVMLSSRLLGWLAPAGTAAAPGNPGGPAGAGALLPTASQGPLLTPLPTAPLATPTPTPTPMATAKASNGKATPAATGMEALENQVVALTNAERVKAGCAALRLDTKLRTAARNHSADIAARRKLTHEGANGSDPGDRMAAAGYDPGGGWAENVAAGYSTPAAVLAGWMGSTGHRNNILNCSLKAIGVGVARASNGDLYWTQDFGGR